MGIISDGIELTKLVNKAANVELYLKLAEWIERVEELKAKNDLLEEQNRQLKESLRFKGSFVRIGPCVYVDGDEDPICSHCADVDNRPIHIWEQRLKDIGVTPMCPRCKNQARYFFKRSKVESLLKEEKI